MDDGPENLDGAGGILSQRVGHAGSARKLPGAERKHFRSGIPPGERGEHTFQRLGPENARSLLTDGRIGIRGKNTKRLNAIFRRERSRLVANGKFSFRGRPAGTNFLQQYRANFRLLRPPSEHPA
jgi:hypothetical protein